MFSIISLKVVLLIYAGSFLLFFLKKVSSEPMYTPKELSQYHLNYIE